MHASVDLIYRYGFNRFFVCADNGRKEKRHKTADKRTTRLIKNIPGGPDGPLGFTYRCGIRQEGERPAAEQNIPIAKLSVYTSIGLERGVSCFNSEYRRRGHYPSSHWFV